MADYAKGDDDFRSALTKLASDPDYRQKAQKEPELIERDFALNVKELQALRQVAVLSGADVSVVDVFRGSKISERARIGNPAEDVDVSCCSCCCCCCGETAVIAA
jgi:hypothetical protein